MGSGEGDAIRNVYVPTVTQPANQMYWTDTTTTSNTFDYTWTYSTKIYMYQVKCPKRGCKKMNWLELDKITPCRNCGVKLKAVSEQADFEVPVDNG